MSRSFRRHGERIRMQLQPVEVELLRSMHAALRESLERRDPDDPVVRRLFPSAVADDDAADADLRGMIHDELLASRLAGLDDLLELLERGRRGRGEVLRVDLADEEPVLVLGVLNDLRLAVGARVGIETLDRAALDPDDPVTYRVAVMDHLAWLQEQLLRELDPPSVRVYEEEDDL